MLGRAADGCWGIACGGFGGQVLQWTVRTVALQGYLRTAACPSVYILTYAPIETRLINISS